MKFTAGEWLSRDGMNLYSPAEIRDVRFENNCVSVYAPTHPINHRGDTLKGPLLTMRYSSPMLDIIKVEVIHFEGVQKKSPNFQLFHTDNIPLEIVNNEEELLIKSGNLSLKIHKLNGCLSAYTYSGRSITSSFPRGLAYIKDKDNNSYMRQQLHLGVGECVYGLGERFTSFVKNGQVVDIWNEDGGTSSELTYKNIPFYITNKGYGVFVNHPEGVSFEVATERVSKVQFSVPGERLEYFIIGGDTLKKVLSNYTALTGKPALPPAWSFGLWLTTSFTTSYDEKTVSSFIDGMKNRDIPLDVFHFDCFWMKEFQWCDFVWDSEVFPDPAAMIKRLKEKGLKLCVWINPYIAQKSYLFAEGMERGYFIKTVNGDVWQWDLWQPGQAIVDFTNPGACSWFAEKLKALLDIGVDCFKTDFGERIPTDVIYYDGSDPIKMHNYYTYLYNKTVFELLKREKGEREAVLFARSATVGGQMFPVHWGGDCSASYESMAESLRGGLSLCMSGFGFWSHDISGFEATATPDLYKRWSAFGLLSTHSRLHGSSSYRVPWFFDDEAVEVLRYFTKLKCSLMPYLFSTACHTADSGIPMVRSMVLEFTDDPACDCLDRQYMLGDSLLVAPIFSTDGHVTYYVPKGTWTNYLTGNKIKGGRWVKEYHNYMSIPLLVRPNSIITVGEINTTAQYDFNNNVTLHAFELEDESIIKTVVYDKQGEAALCIETQKKVGIICLKANNVSKPWNMILRGLESIQAITGGKWEACEFGVKIIPSSDKIQIVL